MKLCWIQCEKNPSVSSFFPQPALTRKFSGQNLFASSLAMTPGRCHGILCDIRKAGNFLEEQSEITTNSSEREERTLFALPTPVPPAPCGHLSRLTLWEASLRKHTQHSLRHRIIVALRHYLFTLPWLFIFFLLYIEPNTASVLMKLCNNSYYYSVALSRTGKCPELPQLQTVSVVTCLELTSHYCFKEFAYVLWQNKIFLCRSHLLFLILMWYQCK